MMGTCGKKRKVAKPPSLNREAFDAVSPQTGELPWMACEIHDGFVQDASAARMLLETALHGGQIVDDGARAQVHRAAELLGKAIREARGLISGSRLPALEELGLVGAIEALIEDLPAGSPTVRFVTDCARRTMQPRDGIRGISHRAAIAAQCPPAQPCEVRGGSIVSGGRWPAFGNRGSGDRVRPRDSKRGSFWNTRYSAARAAVARPGDDRERSGQRNPHCRGFARRPH